MKDLSLKELGINAIYNKCANEDDVINDEGDDYLYFLNNDKNITDFSDNEDFNDKINDGAT